MNREKIEALMSVILKEADPKKFPEKLSEDAIVSFYRANSSYLNCSTLREWLSG